MSKPTPGPWSVIGEPIPVEPVPGYPIVCIEDAYCPVAHVFSDDPAGLANARLIAAAPVLRDALRELVMYGEDVAGDRELCWCIDYFPDAPHSPPCLKARAALAASAPPPTADAGAEDGAWP